MARTNHRINRERLEEREYIHKKEKRSNKRGNRQKISQAIREGDWDSLDELED